MKLFKIYNTHLNLDNITRFWVKEIDSGHPYNYIIYADGIIVSKKMQQREAAVNLDILINCIKDGKSEY